MIFGGLNMFSILMEPTTTGNASIWPSLIMLAVMAVAMYFILIRPQKKKQKEEKAMLDATKIGDEILTIGGIYGRIVAVKEESYIIETGPDRAKMKIAKWAMQQNFTKHADDADSKSKDKKPAKPIEK